MEPERRVVRLSRALIEAAHVATNFGAWQSMVFDHLEPIGFDVAFIKALPPHQAVANRGFDSSVLAMARDRWPVYAEELEPLTLASRGEGVAIDAEVLGPRRERLAYYQELVRPHHGTCSLYATLAVGGMEVGGLMLGRASGAFTHDDVDSVRGLIPALAVGLAAVLQHETPQPCAGQPVDSSLTAREREVLRLVQLGFTNPEIARALGTSPNTVRNQVSSLFQKIGATTRAELVALTVRGELARSPFVP